MDRSGQFQVVEGGREALERAYLWAIVFDRPDKQSLARRLEPSVNDTLRVVAQRADGTRVARPFETGAACEVDVASRAARAALGSKDERAGRPACA